jgi:MFS family permease
MVAMLVWRLLASLALSTIGGIGLWSVVVALPVIEAEFGVDRGGASLPYTATMIGFALGGVLMGRLADRFGIVAPIVLGACMLGAGYLAAAAATSLWQFVLAQALLIGLLGSSATFGPLVADVSLWFKRRRGIAVAVVASGNYLAGTLWPPLLQHAMAAVGWRQAHVAIGIVCMLTMLPLALALRRRAPVEDRGGAGPLRAFPGVARLSPSALQALLVVAGLACCIAMSMPQVHIVAYCADLGYGPARGAEMLSLMLGFGVVSRLGSGLIADRIGGAGTLLLSAVRRARLALRGLGAVRAGAGRHRAELRADRARPLPGARGRRPDQPRADGDRDRHGAGRLDGGRDLRPQRLLSGGVPERHRLEPAQRRDRVPAAALPAADAGAAGLSARDGNPPPAGPLSVARVA